MGVLDTFLLIPRKHTAQYRGHTVVFKSKANPKSLMGYGELFWDAMKALEAEGIEVNRGPDDATKRLYEGIVVDGMVNLT